MGREMDFRLPAIQYQPQIQTDPLTGDYRTGGLLWRSGRQFIFTSGSRNSLQGLGGTGHANMTYIFMPTDRLLLSLGSTLTKYDFYNFSAIETGISGSLHYQINDFMTLNAFGAYYLSHSYNNAGYNPYMRTSYYGASLSVDMHEHFGVEVGAQQYFDPRRGKWQTVPIVAPYIILNNKQRIGIDLGGLLQGAFQTDHYDQAQPARSDWQFDKKPAPPKAPIAPNRR